MEIPMFIANRCMRATFVCFALTCVASASVAQQALPQHSTPTERHTADAPTLRASMAPAELDRTLHAYLAKLSSDDDFSGVVLVARRGLAVFERPYGFADRANRRPNTLQTRFNLGSINKIFTTDAIRQLIAQGRLTLSDTIAHILPSYPPSANAGATLQQLLASTAGLTDLHGPEFAATAKDHFRSNADYFDFVATLPPLFEPGARTQHCNGCFIVLGEIIEHVMQVPYEQYMTNVIFEPAGMTNTDFLQRDGLDRNVAIGYTRDPGGELRSNVYLDGASGSAAGGGYSTARDLLAYVNAARKGGMPNAVMRLVGSAPGVSTTIQTNETWTVIVLANMDPPAADDLGARIFDALTGGQ
jgi:CubicO group peptidase (beta-lactamase class C family)